jgi:hypothetical protein
MKMIELNEIKMMMEAIGLVMDEHGIKCADGHWMTNDELIALPDEEVVALFNRCYGKD